MTAYGSCQFEAAAPLTACYHVDPTHPRGPFGFVQLLLLLLRARTLSELEAGRRFFCCLLLPLIAACADPACRLRLCRWTVRALATADVGLENGPAVAVFGNLVVNVSTRYLSSCVRALHTS